MKERKEVEGQNKTALPGTADTVLRNKTANTVKSFSYFHDSMNPAEEERLYNRHDLLWFTTQPGGTKAEHCSCRTRVSAKHTLSDPQFRVSTLTSKAHLLYLEHHRRA